MQEKISYETKLCDNTKEEIQIVKGENDSSRLRISQLEPKFKNCYQLAFPNSLNSLYVPLPKISVAGVETTTPFESQISRATFIEKQVSQ